ncbi:MAG: hydroxyacid dehydrogenase [Alphaproteobacteria bacterium]|nr:hydroxyacid dehydrogenase [Alphaproteobacteria bacterium]
MSTNKKKLLLSESLAPAARALLDERGDIEQVYFPHMLPNDQFLELIKQHTPVSGWTLGATAISDAQIEAAGALDVTARIGVGYDAIDVPAHTRRGIPVMIAGTANSPSVAEQAMFMMMWLAKRSSELDNAVRGGKWLDRMQMVPFDLFEKTVVVVGFGRIGTRTAKRCAAMDMNVLIYDPYVDDETIKAAGCEPVSDLDSALERADFVSIHCPKTPETIGLFNKSRLSRMKPTAYLVNTARGGIIDEADLYDALVARQIAGAGLDVFVDEPINLENPLLKLDNVITSPHMAGVTREALSRMGVNAVKNILSVFDGAPIAENIVNKEILDR